MFNYPKKLLYTETHEWVKKEGDIYVIGISDYAQDALGDIVFVNLPEVDDEVFVQEPFGDVESVKAVSDLYSPVTGVICDVNEELLDNPALLNEDSYKNWIIKVEEVSETEEFLDAESYREFCESQG
ncbi:MAG TPA: glycine cleavage system protein GcvH [Erysipelotrichaceae bacterium]|jgi:glycine cleavage system H protein|nr:glycine cleavage system protein GcvH [Erysipelotrichaceae bacterium]HQA84979.1 glycine cleavage system protein GcvH [Erysipelotrichaceae bacterium]